MVKKAANEEQRKTKALTDLTRPKHPYIAKCLVLLLFYLVQRKTKSNKIEGRSEKGKEKNKEKWKGGEGW